MIGIFEKLKKYYDEKALLEIKDKSMILIKIMDLKDDIKVNFLENLTDDEKYKILSSFSDKEKMVNYLYTLNSQKLIASIAEHLDNDNLKLRIIEKYIKYDEFIELIFFSCKDLVVKTKIIEAMKWDTMRMELIDSINNIEEKKYFLSKNILPEIYMPKIINNLPLGERLSFMDYIKNYSTKVRIIVTLGDKYIEEELMKEIPDSYKIKLLLALSNEEKRLEYINRLDNKLIKVFLITQLKDFNFNMLKISDSVYMENLIDNEIKFGLELECINKNENVEEILNVNNIFNNWKINFEPSLLNGLEITSPIISNNLEDMKKLYFICDILKNNNYRCDSNCGGHIHFGLDYFKSPNELKTFIELYSLFEAVLYKISNKKGESPRKNFIKYAEPVSWRYKDALKKGMIGIEDDDDLDKFVNEIKNIQVEKNGALNFSPIYNTIEIRIPNGTISYNEVLNNIRLYGKLLEISKLMTYSSEKNILLNDIKEQDEEERLNSLLKLLFLRDDVKKIYYDRYKNSELDMPKEIFTDVSFRKGK